MHAALLVARLVLAAVFAVASGTKLADLGGSRAAVSGFGVPERVAARLGTLLPFGELGVAAALLPASSARYGALGALALLAIFMFAIGRSIARGEAPECHCFGQLHSEPAGPRALARNGALAAVAAFVVLAGWHSAGPSAIGWVGRLNEPGVVALSAGVAIAALAALTSWALIGLLRQNGRLLLRIDELEARLDASGVPTLAHPHEGLPLGEPAPSFALEGMYGERVTLASLTSMDRPVLLLFTDPGCGPCNAMLPQIAAWQREHAEHLTIAVLTRGSAEDNRSKVREHGVTGVWLDPELAAYNAYQAAGTPGAVLLDASGRIASPVVAGAEAIAALVDTASHASGEPVVPVVQVPAEEPQRPQAPAVPSVGSVAPELELVDLGGQALALAEPGRDTLVVFWNPGCGFCQRMLSELAALEQSPPPGAPRVVLISSGSVEENRAMGLSSAIALDQSFTAGRAFGSAGTPSGILIDTDGRVASGLAVGAPAVMALASAPAPRA
jgi:thiol-disulfide isomerase/thioredoxin